VGQPKRGEPRENGYQVSGNDVVGASGRTVGRLDHFKRRWAQTREDQRGVGQPAGQRDDEDERGFQRRRNDQVPSQNAATLHLLAHRQCIVAGPPDQFSIAGLTP